MAKTSTVSKIRTTIAERMESARNSKAAKWLLAATLVVGLIPVVGSVGSYLTDKYRNKKIANDQKDVLAEVYKDQIAMTLGIRPESVKRGDLDLAAKKEPKLFGSLVAKVDKEKKTANRASAAASVAASTVTMIPGVGGAVNGIAKLTSETIAHGAVHVGAAIGGDAAVRIFSKSILHVQDMVEIIDGKQAQGQAITATDIVLLRISQNEEWQKEFKKKYGKPFHQLNDAQKAEVASSMPEMLMDADKYAQGLNRQLISVQQVVMTEPVMETAPRKSFVDMVNAQRASAQPAMSQTR